MRKGRGLSLLSLQRTTLPDLLELTERKPTLVEQFLVALNSGFWEEWDCDLLTGVTMHGFGPPEIRLAAKAAPNEVNIEDRAEVGGGKAKAGETFKVVVTFTTKNAGPHKDSTRADQLHILRQEVERVVTKLHKEDLPWVLEVEC